MDNKRIIYSTRENIKSTLVIFLKYKKSVLWVNFFVALLTLLTQFAATYLPGWIVDLLTGGECRYADLDAGASGRRFDWDQ